MKAVNVWWFEKWYFPCLLCHMDLSMLNIAVVVVVVVALCYVLVLLKFHQVRCAYYVCYQCFTIES